MSFVYWMESLRKLACLLFTLLRLEFPEMFCLKSKGRLFSQFLYKFLSAAAVTIQNLFMFRMICQDDLFFGVRL